jgi:hypothetical protein
MRQEENCLWLVNGCSNHTGLARAPFMMVSLLQPALATAASLAYPASPRWSWKLRLGFWPPLVVFVWLGLHTSYQPEGTECMCCWLCFVQIVGSNEAAIVSAQEMINLLLDQLPAGEGMAADVQCLGRFGWSQRTPAYACVHSTFSWM